MIRKLDDIIPPSRRKEMEPTAPPVKQFDMPSPGGRRGGFPYRTLLGALVIVGLVVGGLFYFSSAQVTITPNSLPVSVSGTYTATKSQGDLSFVVVSAQKVALQSVQGSGTQAVSTNASGTITIFNTQSKTQTLVTNTRFATQNGLVFRIHQTLSIPAGTTANPGSTQATVYADQPGDSYNIDPTSFTLPGLSSTPQFTEVYATSAAPMSGGASGNVPVVSGSLDSSTRASLITALGPDLTNELAADVPTGYVLLPGSATTTYTAQTSTPSATTGMVDVKEQGTISAVVFPEAALAEAIATQTAGQNYNGEPLSFLSVNQLTLSSAVAPSASLESYTFTLSGNATLVYTIDSSRIAAAIAGKAPTSAEVALTALPEVKKAVLVLHPIWRQTFPQDPSQITVVVGNP